MAGKRNLGLQVFKTQSVSGTPLEYMFTSTEILYVGTPVACATSISGKVMFVTASAVPTHILMANNTAGSATVSLPVQLISKDTLYVMPMCSSETVLSTTNIGYEIGFSTSGTGLTPATTGQFKITAIYNTSGAGAQYLVGRIID